MPEPRPAFVFDGSRCTGCEACRIACAVVNGGGRDTGWRQVLTFNPRHHPTRPTRHLSLACNHCDDPVCLSGCPAAAYRRDASTGAVLLQAARCIGCRYCSWVCPYDAPRFDAAQGVMSKCTLCADRLAGGGEPACSQACPTGALAFGERGDGAEEPAYVGLPATGLGPALRIVALLDEGPPPTEPPPRRSLAPVWQPPPPRRIRLASEWSLLVFTLAMPALVAWFGAGLVRPTHAPSPIALLAFGAAALAISTLHLGRPLRSWRTLANLRRSWLSREALCACAFLVLGAASSGWPNGSWPARVAAVAALVAGAALMLAIDAVYRAMPAILTHRLHSAEMVLVAPFLLAVGAGWTAPALALALLRAALLLRRWAAGGMALPPTAATGRLLLLAAACVPTIGFAVAVSAALAGEAIDRASFYAELEPVSPASVMAATA